MRGKEEKKGRRRSKRKKRQTRAAGEKESGAETRNPRGTTGGMEGQYGISILFTRDIPQSQTRRGSENGAD